MTEKAKRGRPKKAAVKPDAEKKEIVKKAARKQRPKTELVTRNLDAIEDVLPDKRIDFRELLYWMDLGATKEEVAGAFHIGISTLCRVIKEKTGFTWSELKEKCCGEMKIKLRENQFRMSETNPTMAIWLGKQWLDQCDSKNNHEVTVNPATKALQSRDKIKISNDN